MRTVNYLITAQSAQKLHGQILTSLISQKVTNLYFIYLYVYQDSRYSGVCIRHNNMTCFHLDRQ